MKEHTNINVIDHSNLISGYAPDTRHKDVLNEAIN